MLIRPPTPSWRPTNRARRVRARAEVERAERERASRTARAALGFDQLLADDVDGMKAAHRAYARRQLTWMRRMEGVDLIDRTGRGDDDMAAEIVAKLDRD